MKRQFFLLILSLFCFIPAFQKSVGQAGQSPNKNTKITGTPFSNFPAIYHDSFLLRPKKREAFLPVSLPRQNDANASVCNTSTFLAHLAAPTGEKIMLAGIQSLLNKDFVLAGSLRQSNGDYKSFICTANNTGQVKTGSQFKIGNLSTKVEAIKVLYGGDIAIAGIIYDGIPKAFACVLAQDQSFKWQRSFDLPAIPVKVTIDNLSGNQLALAIQLPSAIPYLLLNPDGSVIFQKIINPPGLIELAGFSETYGSQMGLVYNCNRAGKQVTEVLSLSTDGGINGSATLGSQPDETRYCQTKNFNARLMATGIKKSNGKFKLVRDILYEAATSETNHEYDLPITVDFNTSAAMDNAGDVMGFCLPADGKLVFLRQFSAYQTTPEYTRAYSVPKGCTLASVSGSLVDNGYIFGLNTTGQNEILLLKTDSIGRMAGCGFEDISTQFSETIQASNTTTSNISNTNNFPVKPAVVLPMPVSLNTSFDCRNIFCPPDPVDDTCLATYFKLYRSSGYAEVFGNHVLLKDNKQLVSYARIERVIGNSNQVSSGIELLDERGNFIKAIAMSVDSSFSSAGLKKIDDQHVMLISTASKNNTLQFIFTLVNDNLDKLWSKAIEPIGNYPYYSGGSGIGDFIGDEEGNFYMIANSIGFYEEPKILVVKFDPNGNILWTKSYALEKGQLYSCKATVTNTSLIVILDDNTTGSLSVQIDRQTGNMLKAYQFNHKGIASLVQFYQDRIMFSGTNASTMLSLGILDTTGKPLKLKYLDNNQGGLRYACFRDGYMYSAYEYYNGSGVVESLAKTDTALKHDYIHAYATIRFGHAVGMDVSPDGSVYQAANFFSGGVNGSYADAVIKKLDNKGTIGTCNYTNISPAETNITLNTQSINFTEVPYNFKVVKIAVDLLPTESFQRIAEILCSSKQYCTSVKLSGNNTICDTSKPYTYRSVKNTGCPLQPIWNYDTSYARLISITDSNAVFSFKKPGSVWLKTTIDAGCKVYSDSLLVSIQNVSKSFSLGRDTVICKKDTIELNAGAGFSTYTWQDGSKSPTYLAIKPGIYFVRVKNSCGDTYSDSIQISDALVPPLNLGNDTSICIGDTLFFTGTTGFKTYTWQPATVMTTPGNKAWLVANKNQVVSLKATSFDGCQAADSLSVIVNQPLPFSLGNDTSFCASDSFIAKAPAIYKNYYWSNGQTTEKITLKTAGNYWLKVFDNNGCSASDTVAIKQVFPLPVVDLGANYSICKNQSKTLDAGSYKSYLWQDGSTNRYLVTTVPGNYAVTVTDINHCTRSDSVSLISINNLPGNFLKATDSICQYEKLLLTPTQNFASYQWSTGSTGKALPIDKAGKYYLSVIDNNGCAGSDTTLVILKNCMTGVFIPSAFTPNNDGKNDNFRALVYGNVLSFRLQVYNRFGELVYSSNDPNATWKGDYKGMPENTNAFVWHCYYELQGGKPTLEKGTVMLIR